MAISAHLPYRGRKSACGYNDLFSLIRNDITAVTADAIVNTDNPYPVIGAGTNSAIHAKAGPELLEARETIGYEFLLVTVQ